MSKIVLFVEQDSLYALLKPLQNLFNIKIISARGWKGLARFRALNNDRTDMEGVRDE